MADLIAILLAAMVGMLKPGVSDVQLEKQLTELLTKNPPAPCESFTADASGVSAKGVGRLELCFSKLLMEPLLVDSASFVVEGISLGKDGRMALAAISWNADISQEALTAALATSQDSIRNPAVAISPDAISISGKYKAPLGARVGFQVDGTLGVEEDTLLMFRIDKTRAAGMNAPGWISRKVEKSVNPVYDLAKFEKRSKKDIEFARDKLDYAFKLKVSTIKPGQGRLSVGGKA